MTRSSVPGSKWPTAALERECDAVARAAASERNNVTFRAAAALGELVAAGLLDETGTADALMWSARAAGLDEREARAVVRSGMARGTSRPREVT